MVKSVNELEMIDAGRKKCSYRMEQIPLKKEEEEWNRSGKTCRNA
jgi:hypothetical protein